VVRSTPWLPPLLGGISGLFGGLVFITVVRSWANPATSFESLKVVVIAALYGPSSHPWCSRGLGRPPSRDERDLAGAPVTGRAAARACGALSIGEDGDP
jgi:hypothetical protein